MYSDVSDILLHCVVFEVTVATMHLKCLIADLLSTNRLQCGKRETSAHLIFSLKLSITHIKAPVCGKELGHGAERNCIRSVLL